MALNLHNSMYSLLSVNFFTVSYFNDCSSLCDIFCIVYNMQFSVTWMSQTVGSSNLHCILWPLQPFTFPFLRGWQRQQDSLEPPMCPIVSNSVKCTHGIQEREDQSEEVCLEKHLINSTLSGEFHLVDHCLSFLVWFYFIFSHR